MAIYFSAPIFFIIFRETLEASIIISVLLAFLKKGISTHTSSSTAINSNSRAGNDPFLYRQLVCQVWIGTVLGLLVCLLVAVTILAIWYAIGTNIWLESEYLWEAVFCCLASILISIMGLAMLRINKMKSKWRVKLEQSMSKFANADQNLNSDSYGVTAAHENRPKVKLYEHIRQFMAKYAMAILPFLTVVREGVEAIVFLGGVSLSSPASAIPLPLLTGLLAGCLVGYLIYQSGTNRMSIQVFLIISTCFLYLVGAALISRAAWYFEYYFYNQKVGHNTSESGSGPGSYNIRTAVWHFDCCNPEIDGVWMIFQALLGWQNTATYGSVISYNLYWIVISCVVVLLAYRQKLIILPSRQIYTLPTGSVESLASLASLASSRSLASDITEH
ncbi:high-affinity iron transporter [Lipomyces oligophaga]|uniref:high-affinity iron transporter n=1 Tax=Lipomyces oligophaga TaxID=45792 RepID=UPI0034CF8D97